jgi:hypothetical protein
VLKNDLIQGSLKNALPHNFVGGNVMRLMNFSKTYLKQYFWVGNIICLGKCLEEDVTTQLLCWEYVSNKIWNPNVGTRVLNRKNMLFHI